MTDRRSRERDFYRRLVEVERAEPEAVLAGALELARAAVGARIGHLALGPAPLASPLWWAASSGATAPELDAIRSQLSAGVVEEARRTGDVVDTSDASRDE